jgi:hypothetical protein
METKLSDLADTLIEAYWILCEPAEVVARAIDEYATWQRDGRPYLYDGSKVSASDFISALDEIVNYFRERGMWPIEKGSN